MPDKPLLSVVFGSYNRFDVLKLLMENLREELKGIPSEIIVVEGGSSDGALEWITKQKDVITIVQYNRGAWRGQTIKSRSWGYFMNLGFKAAQGKYILMVSDDSLLVPGAVRNGIEHFEKQLSEGRKVGAVAFYFRDLPAGQEPTYRVQYSLDHKLYVNHGMYLRSALEEVGWIEEDAYRFYCADQDLCLKLWNTGYEVIDCPTAYVEHYDRHAVRTTSTDIMYQDNDVMIARWKDIFPPVPNAQLLDFIKPITYVDPHNTGRRFEEALPLPQRLRQRAKHIVARLKKRLSDAG